MHGAQRGVCCTMPGRCTTWTGCTTSVRRPCRISGDARPWSTGGIGGGIWAVHTARQRAIVLDAVDEQLTHQPTVETRNRKPMRPNPLAPWELRIGVLRVYYDVEDIPELKV